MVSYTVYNRAGGQAKSVNTRDLAAGHAELGDSVLIVDLDAQKGSVSNFYDIEYDKSDPNADRLTLHLIDQPAGNFDDLIHSAEPGVDIIPRHEELNDLKDILDDKEKIESRGVGDSEFERYAQLLRVLTENNVSDRYDVVIFDPNAKADEAYYSALYASRNVLIPVETDPKGVDSVDDVFDTASNFAEAKGINIGHLATVATRANNQKKERKNAAEQIRNDYDAVAYFKSLGVYSDAASNQQSVFQEIDQLDRVRDSQVDILPKYRTVLAHIYNEVGSPLPASVLDEYDFWTGDDFWGDVTVPVASENQKMEVQ